MTQVHDSVVARYLEWNRRTALHFLYGRPRGAPVFLSFDAEAAELIAADMRVDEGEGPAGEQAPAAADDAGGDASEDFLEAVREVCVAGRRTYLSRLPARDPHSDVPTGVAFLAAMVLAAHRMQDDEQASEDAYFLRLAQLLGTEPPRAGLITGAEEPLWESWNRFLAACGFLATARPGTGPARYLQYVRSQAVLRECDKEALRREFLRRRPPAGMDVDQLGFWLREGNWSRRYLREGFTHPDPHRRAEFYRSTHEVYQSFQAGGADVLGGGAAAASVARAAARELEAGLYRQTDLRGRPTYLLFPRQPERFQPRALEVELSQGRATPLRPLRPGFFRPLSAQHPFVDEPLHLPVSGDPRLKSMLFPRRAFWILTEDPDDPAGSAHATWSRYVEVGQRFALLCRPGPLVDEMRRLRAWRDVNNQKLIDWTSDGERVDGVHEFTGCMVLSYELRALAASPCCQDLLDALVPRTSVSLALAGGLRDPNQAAWFEGHPPTVTSYGFAGRIALSVTPAGGGAPLVSADVAPQERHPLPASLPPGTYIATAESEGVATRRLFRIVAWSDATAWAEPERVWNCDALMAASIPTCGAMQQDQRGSEAGAIP